jgi:hypothetical protein
MEIISTFYKINNSYDRNFMRKEFHFIAYNEYLVYIYGGGKYRLDWEALTRKSTLKVYKKVQM